MAPPNPSHRELAWCKKMLSLRQSSGPTAFFCATYALAPLHFQHNRNPIMCLLRSVIFRSFGDGTQIGANDKQLCVYKSLRHRYLLWRDRVPHDFRAGRVGPPLLSLHVPPRPTSFFLFSVPFGFESWVRTRSATLP